MKENLLPKLKKLFVYREYDGQWHQFGTAFGEADLTRRKAQEEYNDAVKRRSTGERKPSWKIIEVDEDVDPPRDISNDQILEYTIIAQK